MPSLRGPFMRADTKDATAGACELELGRARASLVSEFDHGYEKSTGSGEAHLPHGFIETHGQHRR